MGYFLGRISIVYEDVDLSCSLIIIQEGETGAYFPVLEKYLRNYDRVAKKSLRGQLIIFEGVESAVKSVEDILKNKG